MIVKLCGRNEPCFEEGTAEYGHLGGIMCKHVTEDHRGTICGLDNELADVYTTENKYKELMEAITP